MDQSTSAASSSLPIKRRRLWRRLAFALVLLFLAAGSGLVVFLWTATSDLDAVVAELDRLDPGWRMEAIEANRKAVPDEDNSALQIIAVRELLGGNMALAAKLTPKVPPQVQLNDKESAEIDKYLEGESQAVFEARKLRDMPAGRWPIKYDDDFTAPIPRTATVLNALNVARFLVVDAARRAHASDADGAIESCLAIEHAAQSMGNDPSLMAQLVRGACTTLAVGALERTLAQNHFTRASEASLKQMQAALTKELPDESMRIAMHCERAFTRQVFQALVRRGLQYLLGHIQQGRGTQAKLRCAVAALAAERFRLAHNRWPESLDVLVQAGFLDAILIDPFDGKPLRLKRRAEGLVIYSVGEDGIDNDGNVDSVRPSDPGKDLGFRLWDTAWRRQAPIQPAVAGE
ncbi:MAG TPA: hypothetical protein VNX28_17400 [Gemmataceae bacterium]|jgi:hypothetical protein|nr:hypothetical protein [Gemmataceae bacterium]